MKATKPIETNETCKMVLTGLGRVWECSKCKTWRTATRNFETKRVCPHCCRTIAGWIGLKHFDDEGEA